MVADLVSVGAVLLLLGCVVLAWCVVHGAELHAQGGRSGGARKPNIAMRLLGVAFLGVVLVLGGLVLVGTALWQTGLQGAD